MIVVSQVWEVFWCDVRVACASLSLSLCLFLGHRRHRHRHGLVVEIDHSAHDCAHGCAINCSVYTLYALDTLYNPLCTHVRNHVHRGQSLPRDNDDDDDDDDQERSRERERGTYDANSTPKHFSKR